MRHLSATPVNHRQASWRHGLRLTMVAIVIGATFGASAQGDKGKASRLYEDALKRYEKEDLSGAAVQLRGALKEDNRNLAAHLLLGKILHRAGELKAAEAAYETALKQGVSKVEVATLLGQIYLQLGNTRQLLDTITTAGLPNSVQSEVLTLRGSAMAMGGNLTGATQAFAEARTLDPKSALPNIAEAPILLRAGERDRARTMAQKATEMAPDNSGAWYQLGNILISQGDSKGALAAYDKALAANPKHVDSHVGRASVLMSLGRNDEAAVSLKTLKDAKVREPRASFLRATLASAKGDSNAAKPEYTEAVNMIDVMSPNVRAQSEPLLLAGALSHRALGNMEKTREYLETLLGRNSRHLQAQMLLASVLLDAREYNRAVPLLEGLLRANPNDPQALYMMGNVHLARRQYAQASEMLDKAMKLSPNGPALRDLSFSQLGLGQEKQGIGNLEKAYAQNPKDLRAGIELAIYYARQGNAKRAVKIAEDLVALDPNNLAMINFLGNVKGRLGDTKGLKEAYELALSKDPKFRPVVMNMSWLDMEEGRLEQARARLMAFLKDNPKDPDVLYQLGALEQMARRPVDALNHWTQMDGLQDKDPRGALAIVDLYLQERLADKALVAAKALVARYGDTPQAQMSLARSYLASGDATMARQALQDAATKAGFDPELLLSIGRIQLQAGHPDGATHSANKVLQAQPGDASAMALLVEVAARRGVPAEVDKAMAAMLAKNPGHPLTLVTAGHIAFSRNQPAIAAGLYKQVFDRVPSTTLALNLAQAYAANKEAAKGVAVLDAWSKKQPKDLLAQRALADMQLFAGQNDAARQSYDALIKSSPHDATLVAAYARALAKLNDPGALAMAERAYKLAPGDTAIADAYGWMLTQRGDVEAAVRILREARLREPGNATVRWHLAAALAKAKKPMEAKDELQAALKSSPPPSPDPALDRLRAELGL